MNYYDEIKHKIINCEIYSKVRDYSRDRNKLQVYFEIGKLLSLAGKEYGKNIIKQFSDRLVVEVGKKYNDRTLRRIRQFYEVFCDENWSTLWTKLTWSHYREVLVLKDINAIRYYLNLCENNNLTQRQLHELILNDEYGRLDVAARNKIINSEKVHVGDLIPNPIIINNYVSCERFDEYALKQTIIVCLDSFLSQLGFGFTYVGNEYRIKFADKYNYIDLLLFNVEYNCYVVVELKATELKKEHIGQIQVYMNYIDQNIKKSFHDTTIGVIICKKENKYIIEYSSDNRIVAREYKLV